MEGELALSQLVPSKFLKPSSCSTMHLGRPEAPQVLNLKSFVNWNFTCIKGSEAPALHDAI